MCGSICARRESHIQGTCADVTKIACVPGHVVLTDYLWNKYRHSTVHHGLEAYLKRFVKEAKRYQDL